ncbi:MAG TPA: hypothetical protein DIW47_15810 [Bacteroidetes bacterium]|nr:hypothetical protein [Bacteroidota bacterium]
MKKFLCILFLGVLSTLFCSQSGAQSRIYKINFALTDQYNYMLRDSIFFSFRNTDSSTTSNNPYTSVTRYDNYSSVYDSGTVATNYSDSMITIRYKACGQWFTLDTFFRTFQNQWAHGWYLSMHLMAPCVNPCTAAFNFYIQQNALKVQAYPEYSSGPFTYHWYYGDGVDASIKYGEHTYAAPGNYTLSLVIHDTLNQCKDSVAHVITISPQCNPSFYAISGKYGHSNIYANNNAYPGFQHTWVIGDSVYSNGGGTFSYRFGAGGFKPIKHIVEYPGHCKDSVTVNVSTQSCQTEIQSHSILFRTLTIQPENNVDTFKYEFGDGTFDTAVGPVSHTYNWSNTFQVKISDLHQYCYKKYLSVSISQNCSGNFGSQVDSLYKMKFFTTHATPFVVRRIIDTNNDTLYGDTVSYYFSSRGQYIVQNQFLDSLGTVVCTNSDYILMNSCGKFDYQQYWNNMIHGEVRFGSSNSSYDSLIVYLIEYDSVAGTLTGVDSTILYSNPNDSGYFAFYQLCDSTKIYLVKAALLPGSGMYGNYLPTYYNQSASWSGASRLGTYGNFALNMLAGTNLGGPGFIGGYISQGANKKFKPLEGIQVNLFDDNDTPIAFDLSDVNGYYEFPSLPYGTYRVTVEIMGKPSDSYMITLSATNEKAEAQDFEVNSTYVSTINTAVHVPELAGRIYPNPAKDQLIIEWSEQAEASITLRFYSVHGQLLAEYDLDPKTETTSTLNIAVLPRGMYMLQIESGTGQSIHRIQLD